MQLVDICIEPFLLPRRQTAASSEENTYTDTDAVKKPIDSTDLYALLDLTTIRYKASFAQIKSACTFFMLFSCC
jgi:hypothetical protein